MIFSAASSGTSILKVSSNAMISSTVSRLSAPRSSIKDAFGTTLASATPKADVFCHALHGLRDTRPKQPHDHLHDLISDLFGCIAHRYRPSVAPVSVGG